MEEVLAEHPDLAQALKDAKDRCVSDKIEHKLDGIARSHFAPTSIRMFCRPTSLTLSARTHFPQKLPGIDSQIVAIVPVEFDGVLSYAFGEIRVYRRL